MNAVYTFAKGGALISSIDQYSNSKTIKDYGKATGNTFISAFLSFLEWGCKSAANEGGPTAGTIKNIGNGAKIISKLIGIQSIYSELKSAPSRNETLECYTFKIAQITMEGAQENISNKSLLDIYNKKADVLTVRKGLNAIYNSLDEMLSDYDLTNKKSITEASIFINENFSNIIQYAIFKLNQYQQK